MKYLSALVFTLLYTLSWSQALPIDFESEITTADFVDFDGGIATVIANPQSHGINTSNMVAQIVRDGGAIWSGSKIDLESNLDFTVLNSISMKVFTSAPIGTIVKFKLEGTGATERDAITTVTNAWEELTWDFTAEPANFNSVVFMFDFGNVGDGTENSTFLFDDVRQEFGGYQIDWPVDFENSEINYMMTDFGGNSSSRIVDPTNPDNHVIEVIKTGEAATWAGTTIGTNSGFLTDLPFSSTDTKMYANVWSPSAGTPIRLKVENSNDPTQTCETQTNTSVSEEWEVLEFDFAQEALGTAQLSLGLQMGWRYNMASIFFNFGTEGMNAGEQTYYFDNLSFGDQLSYTEDIQMEHLEVFPNPSNQYWKIHSDQRLIEVIQIFDLKGKLLKTLRPNSSEIIIDATHFASGTYITKLSTSDGSSALKLVKE